MKFSFISIFKKKRLLAINFILLLIIVYLGCLIFRKNLTTFFNEPICPHCNVILISLDTLGASHLPCYGYDRNTAQNLCNFAKNNILFTQAYSNAGWTLPSHFSIFTSLYPNHHGMLDYGDFALDKNIPTLAELFQKANYKTIYTGPLDDQALPLQRGLGRGFTTFLSSTTPTDLLAWQKPINQLISNNEKQQSTFLFLHTYWVHAPYIVKIASNNNSKRIYTNDYYPDIAVDWDSYYKFSSEFENYLISKYENKIIADGNYQNKIDQNIVNHLKMASNLDEAEKTYKTLITDPILLDGNYGDFYTGLIQQSDKRVSYAQSLYDEMIFYLDKRLSMIFDLVKNAKLANNTIIIITSDHGEEFMEHGNLTHPADHLYNTTTAVPLIMYVPGVKQKEIKNLAQSIDILPTVLSLVGITAPKNIDGLDLSNLINGNKSIKYNDYLISNGYGVDAIRNSQWKLYTNNFGGNKLYNLDNDPSEKNNLTKQKPKIVKNLLNNLNRIIYRKQTESGN